MKIALIAATLGFAAGISVSAARADLIEHPTCPEGFHATGAVLTDMLQREMAMQAELKEMDERDRKVMALLLLKQQ